MSTIETGFGGEVPIGIGAIIVAVISAVLLLAFFLLLGRPVWQSVVDVALFALFAGGAFYLGLRFRS